jgi:hypothetical protein
MQLAVCLSGVFCAEPVTWKLGGSGAQAIVPIHAERANTGGSRAILQEFSNYEQSCVLLVQTLP